MKKFLSVLLALAMVLALLPAGVLSVSALQEGDYTYTVFNSIATITRYTGAGVDVTIPDKLGGFTVTTIGKEAFRDKTSVTSVTMPDGIISIVDNAFLSSGLTIVTIPDTVIFIGHAAFGNTPWENNQPDGLVYAGKVLYKYKDTMPANTSISLHADTKSITDQAFYGCSGLISINIPDSVTTIGRSVFYGCDNLLNFNVDINNDFYSSENGVLFDKSKEQLVQFPGGKTGSYAVPNGVVYIMNYSFAYKTNLISLTLPETVTFIGAYAFIRTYLESIVIPASVQYIAENAFRDCSIQTIYCCKNSQAHYSALYNSLNYELVYLKASAQGNPCLINYSNKYVTGLSGGVASFGDYFATEPGYTLAYTPTQNGFGTGTIVYVLNNNSIVETYKAVIYGDVNGDSHIDSIDAGTIVDHENYIVTWDPSADVAYIKAADLNGDGTVDSIDAGIAVDAENYLVTIDQSTGLAS